MTEKEFDKATMELQIKRDIWYFSELLHLYYQYYGSNFKPRYVLNTIWGTLLISKEDKEKIYNEGIERFKSKYNISSIGN